MPLNRSFFTGSAVALAAALLLSACGDSPESLMSSAKEYMAKNDHKAATIQIKNVLQKQPDSAEARYLLGVALLNTGDSASAEIELRKAYDLKYDQAQVAPQLALALMVQGKAKQVVEMFGATQLSSPPAAVARLQTVLSSAYGSLGNTSSAKQALDKALAAEPQNADALLLLSRQKLTERDVNGALAQIEAVLARDPKHAEAWRLKGDILQYLKGQPDEALAAYRKSIETQPDDARGYFALIGLLTLQGKLDDAAKELAALKKLAPKHPETVYLDTQLAYAKKEFPKARELAQELLRLAPTNPRALELAGGVDLQRNALVTAEEHLAKAVQASPNLTMARRWLAMTYVRSGQAAKAQQTIAPVINDQTSDPTLLSLAGEVALMNGDNKKAEEFFTRASKADPTDARKRTVLAMTQIASGQLAAGLDQLEDIAASDKGTSADMALVSTYLRQGDMDKALKAIESLEKKIPESAAPGELRGRVLLAKGDRAGARKSFEASLAKSPGYFASLANLAAMDVGDRNLEAARKRFEDLIAREPKNMQAMVALAELQLREGTPEADKQAIDVLNKAIVAAPTEVAPRLLLIEKLLQQGDGKQAASVAQSALAAIPDYPSLLDASGRAQIMAGDTNQGLTTLAKATTLQPRSIAPLLRLADAQRAAKNAGAAEQSLRKVLDLQPNSVEAYQRLISIRLEQDKLPEALQLARALQKQQPKSIAGFVLEGDARASKKDLDGAATAYQAALKAQPVGEVVVRLHKVLRDAGKPAEAERQAAQWLQAQPQDVVVPVYLAEVAMADKRLEEAEKRYQQVIKQQPNNAVAYNNLAWVAGELKRDTAVGYAEKANQLSPNQPAFMDTLAMLLADKADYKQAIDLQAKVLARQGDNPVFKLNMARIYAKAGRKDDARKLLDEVAKLGDKFGGQPEVEKLRATL